MDAIVVTAVGWHLAGKVCNSFLREGICSQASVHNTNIVILILTKLSSLLSVTTPIITIAKVINRIGSSLSRRHAGHARLEKRIITVIITIIIPITSIIITMMIKFCLISLREGRASIVGKVDQPRFWPPLLSSSSSSSCHHHHHHHHVIMSSYDMTRWLTVWKLTLQGEEQRLQQSGGCGGVAPVITVSYEW